MHSHTPIVISKGREPHRAREKFERDLTLALGRAPGNDVTVVPHLYDLAADGAAMRFLQAADGDLVVLAWLYPRAAYWVLDANGVRGRLGRTSSLHEGDFDEVYPFGAPQRTIWCFDLRTHRRVAAYADEIERLTARPPRPATEPVAAAGGTIDEAVQPRWYPVIDHSRCGQCLECTRFCLFGVFAVDQQQRPKVAQADACRAACLACGRVCPSGAILFPHHDDPKIAGQ